MKHISEVLYDTVLEKYKRTNDKKWLELANQIKHIKSSQNKRTINDNKKVIPGHGKD